MSSSSDNLVSVELNISEAFFIGKIGFFLDSFYDDDVSMHIEGFMNAFGLEGKQPIFNSKQLQSVINNIKKSNSTIELEMPAEMWEALMQRISDSLENRFSSFIDKDQLQLVNTVFEKVSREVDASSSQGNKED